MRSTYLILPFLALALSITGIVFVTLGLRGRPVFATPRCRKCGYDLRNMQFMSDEIGNCPECGAPLAGPKGVTFGRWERRPKQVILGVALLALPWLAMIPANYIAQRTRGPLPGAAGLAAQPTPVLLAALPKSMNSPWEWQELESRLKAGKLTTADVDAALAALTSSFNADRAAGRNRQPLHWVGSFATAVIRGNSASPAAIDALCRAYYGDAPPLKMRKLARAGEPIPVALNQFEPWDLNGLRRCWAITSVTTGDGASLATRQRYNRRDPLPADALSGTNREGESHVGLDHALRPGEHELTFAYESGVVPENSTFVGTDGRPGTPDKWPKTGIVARWATPVKRKVTIVPKDQPLVTLVADETRSPFKSSTISVEQALARPASKGVEILVKWKVSADPSPVVAYRVWLQAGTDKIDYGTIVMGKLGNGSINSYTPSTTVRSLAPDVKTVNVVLTPDPKAAEQHLDVEEIWGQPLKIPDVALERFDVPK